MYSEQDVRLIDYEHMSARLRKCLQGKGYKYLYELLVCSPKGLLLNKNIGIKTYYELINIMERNGLDPWPGGIEPEIEYLSIHDKTQIAKYRLKEKISRLKEEKQWLTSVLYRIYALEGKKEKV